MESTTAATNVAQGQQQPWFLKTSYPVDFPTHKALYKPWAEFESIVRDEVTCRHQDMAVEPVTASEKAKTETTASEAFTVLSDTTSAEIRKDLEALKVEAADEIMSEATPVDTEASAPAPASGHPFMDGLQTYGSAAKKQQQPPVNMEGMMLTDNGDLTYRTTSNSLVDLFQELEDLISGPRLADLLQSAWQEDPLMTLKIVFNARSIHLGKSSKTTFYRSAGWIAQNHPLTLIANLRWLCRPIIEKKVTKKDKETSEVVIVEAPKDENSPTRFDVINGVAHGYWKDLLNLLALAVNGKLTVLSNPRDVLNIGDLGRRGGRGVPKNRKRKTKSTPKNDEAALAESTGDEESVAEAEGKTESQEQSKAEEQVKPEVQVDHKKRRQKTRDRRHEAAIQEFETNPVYRALHLTVARLFAEQLEKDLAALRGSDPKAKRRVSLCGKWAPSHGLFHDKHTFVASTIAEILYPRDSLDDLLSPTDTRETYLRYAREQYRKDTSALRKHLEIVERDITTNNFKNIKYDRIPSLAMKSYSKLFVQKDLEGFEKYIDRVAVGKASISGATLLPAQLAQAASRLRFSELDDEQKKDLSAAQLLDYRVKSIEAKVVDGQWNTLVQRIKDSGTLESSIAVADVSGSMWYPVFPDSTTPLDSSAALSLLVAEVTKPPFGGTFISFSATPEVHQIDLKAPLHVKYGKLRDQFMGYNTNFVSVFEDLILPMAVENKLKQEDMVKRVFVFSDMQFDEAEDSTASWSTSYERIKKLYEDAGYEIPELVFWNLAGGRDVYGNKEKDSTAPKPVTSTDVGTCLVSGYSQGMLKVFLEDGGFDNLDEEEPEHDNDSEEEEVVVTKEGDGDEDVAVSQPKKKKAKIDPLELVKKAVGHKAYGMLQVYD